MYASDYGCCSGRQLLGGEEDGPSCCGREQKNFPPAPSTVWATASPALGQAEYNAVMNGKCYCDWPTDTLQMNNCRYCTSGVRPAGYPFGPPVNSEMVSDLQQLAEYDNMQRGGDCSFIPGGCAFGPRDWIAPLGARSVMVAPGVWQVLPNQYPPSCAINAFNNWRYVGDIYANQRGKLFPGCYSVGRSGTCGSCGPVRR